MTPAGEDVTVPVPFPILTTVRGMVSDANIAVTGSAPLMVTEQVVAVPEQAPVQPEKLLPEPGVSVSVTTVPEEKFELQVVPQLIPAGEEVTVPDPEPAFATDKEVVLNIAVTDCAWFMVIAQGPVPEQTELGLQPVNVLPEAGVAASVTAVPVAKVALQVVPQLMPAGDETTVPEPAPASVTERVGF